MFSFPRLPVGRAARSPAVQVALARAVGAYLALALRTTRWTLHGQAHMETHAAGGSPCVVVFWHERLPLMPMLWVLARRAGHPGRVHVLVSRHRDGRFIGDVVRRFDMDLAYGSTDTAGKSRGGAAAVRHLLGLLKKGDHVAITPDGPRGPRRHASAGAVQLAALAGVPLLPGAAQTTAHRLLPTWDRMVLPLPFGRGVVVCGPPLTVPRDDWQAAVPALEAALNEAADRADALCAVPPVASRPARQAANGPRRP